ncbi:MAG: flagellar filament capping protein FliD [Lachnospiraceae bacterium]|nr:flagellar filament capping protein FliD [Lachnospiraceae bacterium]
MSSGVRISGMNSNLDTEAIVEALVSAKKEKLNTYKGEQKKLEWKQDAWKSLNSKIYKFYSKSLSNARFKTDYTKKTTKSSSSAVSVISSNSAPDCVQTLKIVSMAKSGYHTGVELKADEVDAGGSPTGNKVKASYTASTKLSELVKSAGNIQFNGKSVEITDDMTIGQLTSTLNKNGATVNFDEKNQRFFVAAKSNGAENDFSYGSDADSIAFFSKLGLLNSDGSNAGSRINGESAEIELNGEKFVSDTNTFDINGLTITINNMTDDEISLTTSQDTEGIYDMVKNLFKEYNELINEMDKLYNAESASKYKMLTDEQKEEMSEDEVKEWETKIKSSLLRRDSSLNDVISGMKQTLLAGVKMSDGNTMFLSDFGINTASYSLAKDNERGAYHIDGDEDDDLTSTNEDKLRKAIATDADQVAEFFSSLAKNLYAKMDELMGRVKDYSSAFTVYNDIYLKKQYDEYTTKISEQETKVNKWEDYYYKKFTAMEKAMSGINSKQSAISGLFGM